MAVGGVSRHSEITVRGPQRRTERATCVASGGMYPDAVEQPLLSQLALRHTVEGDATRQNQVTHPGDRARMGPQRQDCLLQRILD